MVRRTAARDERGQILILTALSMTVLLGMAALSVDASYMYDKRNRLYAAADAAAKLGAAEVHRNSGVTLGALQLFANQQVISHGFVPGACGSTTAGIASVCINHPPANGPFAGNAGYVEALISEPTNTFFGNVLGMLNMTPGARAVAGVSSGAGCIIVLGGAGASEPLMALQNNAHLNMPGCEVDDNGNLDVGGGTTSITANGVAVSGTCSGTCTGVNTNAPTTSDPLASLPAPSNPYGSSTVVTVPNNATVTIPPGWYSKIDIGNSAIINFTPGGLYWITGPITVGNSATITGSGVLFYLTGTGSGSCLPPSTAGCISIPNGAVVTLSAQTSGTYSGILFFQNPTDSISAQFNNAGTYDLSGAMYFPTASVAYGNSGGSNDCTLLVAKTLTLGGGQNNFSNTCSSYGGSPILTVSVAE